MANETNVQKMRATLLAKNHKPKVLGGNGRPATQPQRMLKERLGDDWALEWIVPTKKGSEGFPHHYKLDIAHPVKKVAIEVDGASHLSRKGRERDRRKDAFLRENGWQLFRFWNKAVMADLEGCAQTVMSTTSK